MTKIISLAIVSVGFALSGAWAQETPPSSNTESRSAVIVRAESDGNGEAIETIAMSTDGGDFFTFAAAPGMAGPVMFGGGNPLEPSEFLLNNPGVQKELELLDGQREQIQQMQNEFGKEIKTKLDTLMKGGSHNDEQIGAAIQELNQRKKSRLSEILLPHQVDRLKQISLQMNVNQSGLGQALASKALMEQLGIDEKQKEALEAKARELADEFEKKVSQLKSEMRDELMDELTPDQRQKMKDLMGQKFEFQEPANRMRLGTRGARNANPALNSSGN